MFEGIKNHLFIIIYEYIARILKSLEMIINMDKKLIKTGDY